MNTVAPKFYGKLAPRHDVRRLMLGDYLLSPLAPAPAACDRTASIPVDGWGTMLNTAEGCCTCSSQGHLIMSASAMTRSTPIVVPDSAIQTAYEAVSGYNPATGANDNGALITDVNEYRRTVGIGGYKITAWTAIPYANAALLSDAVYYFGAANIGVQLPSSAEQQFDAGEPWTVPWFSPIAGGHCIPIVAYDANYAYCVTWGKVQPMTWDFYAKYCDEAYVLVDPLLFDAGTGLDPTGLDVAALTADLTTLAAAA